MTDYLRLAQERAPQSVEQEDNPYLPLARQQQEMQQNRARTVIETALKDNPDVAAERLRLSQTSGLPPDVVRRNLEELRVKEQARAIDLVNMAQESPVLYRQLTDATFATTSIDDLDTLKNLERAIVKGVNYLDPRNKNSLSADVAGLTVDVGLAATAGVGEMLFNVAGTLNDLLGWQSGAEGARAQANRSREARQSFGFQPESSTGQAVKSGVQSAGTNLALLPLGLARATYSASAQAGSVVAGAMAAGVGADAYLSGREQGLTQGEALRYAIPQAGFEYLFEKIPASKLFGDIAANTGLLKTLGKQAVSEGWTEQVTTLAQDFNEWMNLNPDKTLGQFIQERPEAAYQTFIATLVGVGVQTTTINGINKIIERSSNEALVFEQDLLQQQLQLAAQSALRERSPEQFRAHVQRVVESDEGVKKEIYVDAEVLNQLPQELQAQLPESVREALPDALETRSTVAIPMADVLTVAPGTELEQILNDNARMRPNAASRVEAQQAAEFLAQDAQRVLEQAADTQAWQESSGAVQQTILDQLNATGRFTPDVNEAYAMLQANFFSSMAARLGITPQELYDRYSLKVAAKSVGGEVLNAGGPDVAIAEDRDETALYSVTATIPSVEGNAFINAEANGDGTFEIQESGIPEGARGQGLGVRLYDGLLRDLFARGAPRVTSDSSVSADAQRVYAALRNRGYVVEQSPSAVVDPETGALEADGPVYSVSPPVDQSLNQSTQPLPDTIEIDGVERSTTNSNGQPIAATDEAVRNFWRWFGDSKVVDDQGRPLVVYHGTSATTLEAFDDSMSGSSMGSASGLDGFYFTADQVTAGLYAKASEKSQHEMFGRFYNRQNIMPVFLSMQNPLVYKKQRGDQITLMDVVKRRVIAEAKRGGHDGVIFQGFRDTPNGRGAGVADVFVAFNPEQIKSAIGNSGEFSPANPSILQQGQAARGTFSPEQLLITLGETADLSTFLHESGHFFLEVMADLASQPNAPQQIVDDMNTVLGWFGIKGNEAVGGQDAGGSSELAQMATRAEPTGKISPITRKPIFSVFDASGAELDKISTATSDDDAVLVYNRRQELRRSPPALVNVEESPPPEAKHNKRSTNWKIVRGQEFTNLDEDDGYLYHVTTYGNALQINKNGLIPNRKGMFGDAYAGHSANRVFVTERSGVSFWVEKVEQWTQHDSAEPKVTVVRIPKDKVTAKLQPDTVGSKDARAPAYFVEGEALAQGGNLPTDNTQPAGRTPLEVWNAMTLGQKREHHERWAESFEQYLFEGKAPSPEMQPLFRRFRAWMLNVYKSLQQFMRGRDLQLGDDIRQVFDRMLATDEQIAQAEESAGMLPDFDATNEAIEKLQARSLRDLKWAVNARNKYIKKLQAEAKELRKAVEEEVRAEVEATPEMQAKAALDALRKSTPESKAALAEWKAQRQAALDKATEDIKAQLLATEGAGLKKGQFLAKNKRRIANEAEAAALAWERSNPKPERTMVGNDLEIATVADSFGYGSVEEMLQAIDAFGPKDEAIEGMTDQRMLERHGDLVDARAIEEAANEAVHNEARARSLATELKSQSEMMSERQDTGRTDASGRPITVNALANAAKQFALNLAARRRIKDLKNAAWQHRSAEARAGKAWQLATTKGETEAAVQAKRDQVLNNAAAAALQDAQAEVKKALEFFKRITNGSDEKTVERGRDPDVINAMRAILAAYGVAPRLEKSALAYMETVAKNDPAMYAALNPAVNAAMLDAKPLKEMTVEELRGLTDTLRSMWNLAKRSRQMEVDGNLLDIEDAADEIMDRMEAIGIPDQVPGEKGSITDKEERGLKLQFAKSILRRVEQWAEALDGKFGGPFLRLVFQPVKEAADRYRTARVDYRKRYTDMVKGLAPLMPPGAIDAPELGYKFGNARDSGTAELLHAILHTGNDSNKRKLLLGRGWASENADGTLDTSKWDAFIQRMIGEGKLRKEHYDFAQGVWDLLEETKPLAQKAHRQVFGRYFAEVTANEFTTPFGTYRGGYVPAQTDSRLVKDAKLRELAEGENESMAYAFPAAPSGFTKARVDYNKPLLLDLRTLSQHIDKVLLFSHMQPVITDVRRLLTDKRVSYALDRIDPGAYEGMLIPWLNRSAKQIVETPEVGDRKLSRFLSTARSRAGMALMFANLSNTVQQITGFSLAAVKVKPALMLKATAQFTAGPKAFKQAVADASPYMKDRMLNDMSAMNDAVEEILVDPSLLERGQAWTQRHAYFLQSAADNVMSPIIWTAAYNQAIGEGQNAKDAVRFADGVVRQTQGSLLPEDVSRFETGRAALRLFTQFVSYFNMMANTNATAVKQIADEMGVRKGAGKILYVAMAGLLVPIWVAEVIAQAFRGGPDDEDGDGYLDDWLAAVFGFGTIKGLTAQVPIVGQGAQLVINRFNDKPADDKFSLSPAVSLIESSVGAPNSVYKAIMEEGSAQKAVRDTAAAATLLTGLPIYAAARPVGYLSGVADDRINPTGPVDLTRGLVTGTASPESKQP